ISQQPNPIAEIFSSVRPKRRYSISLPLCYFVAHRSRLRCRRSCSRVFIPSRVRGEDASARSSIRHPRRQISRTADHSRKSALAVSSTSHAVSGQRTACECSSRARGLKLTRRGTLLSISSARRWRLDGGSSRWPPATPPRASTSKPARLSEPRPIDVMMSAFASGWNVIVRKRTLEDNNYNLRKLVTYPGTGPFRSVRRVENEVWVMERNPNYWNKGLPYLDGIEFYHVL